MKQRSQFNYADMDDFLNQKKITEVECLVPDLTGVARGKILPREKFREDRGMRMPEGVLGMTVNGEEAEGVAYREIVSEADHDMMLVPDPTTVRSVPWAQDPTAQVIHDCYFQNGELIDYAPRSVLRRVLALYAAKGWKPVVAPELEFYLISKNTDINLPLSPPIGRSGRAETSRQHYSIDAVNEFDPLFEDIYDYCAAMDLELDTLIHEVGAGQMEVNFLHGEPLELADKVFFYKRTLREAAMRHNVYATFMAKPMAGEPGSAMHIHQSLESVHTGDNIFSRPDGGMSDLFLHYLAGLEKYMPHAMVFLAPYVNSYRRLVDQVPLNNRWAYDNRMVAFRIPKSDPQARRIENRLIGSDANPYVAMAVTLACGYLGMVQQLKPMPEVENLPTAEDEVVPRSLTEALALLEEVPELHEVLGPRFVRVYSEVKETEYTHFMRVISPWEREHLLLHV